MPKIEQINTEKIKNSEDESKVQTILSEIKKLPEEGQRRILAELTSEEAVEFAEAVKSGDFRFHKNIQMSRYDKLGAPKLMGISCNRFSDLVPDPKPQENLAKILLVIPENMLSFKKQLELLDKIHEIELEIDLKEIEDLVGASDKEEMYWVYGVDYGKNQTEPPLDARELFKKQGRRGLTFREAIALLLQHPNILKSHFLLATGSSYKKDFVPYISLTSEGKILIGARSPQCNMVCFGNPSCKDQSKIKTPEAINKK